MAMRRSFIAAGSAAALVLVFACSSEDNGNGGTSSGVLPDGAPEGSVVLEDGAVVGPDGEVITPEDARPPSKVNVTTETVDVDGAPRKYVLAVPKTHDPAKKYPLVLALHGDGQDAASFRPFLGLEDFSGDAAIIAYTDRSEDLFTPYDQNKDQKLIEAVIAAVKSKWSVDDAKVWGLGYSKGAYMLNEIACRRPGVLKAMAIHAGGAPQARDANGRPDCPGAVGLPTFVTHGELDDPGGGEFGAAYWASTAGCASNRTATTPAPCQKYEACPADKPVLFCVIPGQPHYPLWSGAAAASWTWFQTL